jgi:hypothetical protein
MNQRPTRRQFVKAAVAAPALLSPSWAVTSSIRCCM